GRPHDPTVAHPAQPRAFSRTGRSRFRAHDAPRARSPCTVSAVQRQCARLGCNAAATATFTFDARELTVWLDPPADGGARAGELCERHVRVLTPPQGWY